MFKKFSTGAAVLALAGTAFFNPVAQAGSRVAEDGTLSNPQAAALEIFIDSNEIRGQYGLSETVLDQELSRGCAAWAKHLVDTDDFTHDYGNVTGYYDGENLYWGAGLPASDVALSWMESPEHRRILLDPNHVRQGVAV